MSHREWVNKLPESCTMGCNNEECVNSSVNYSGHQIIPEMFWGAKAPSIKDHMLNAYVNMTFSQEDQVARRID